MKTFIFLLFVSPVLFFAQTNKNNWKTLNKSNFSIQYPAANWELDQTGQMNTAFIIFSSLESKQDKFRENINLVVQDLSGQNMDLNKYTSISENQIKTSAKKSKIILSTRIKSKTEYHKIIFTADQGAFHLEFEQYYWVIKNKAYILTFTSEKTKFESFKNTAEKILNSFKLTL